MDLALILQRSRFARTSLTLLALSSTKTHSLAPRERHSIPSWPVPAKRSSTRLPSMSNWMMLNMASLTISVVGRTAMPCGSSSLRPRAAPVMTLI